MKQNVSNINNLGQYGSDIVRQLMQSQNQIYSFILTLVPKWSDAEDILQDTAQILWQKYGQTQEIGSFTGLGIRIAQNLIYNYYRRQKPQGQFLEKKPLKKLPFMPGIFAGMPKIALAFYSTAWQNYPAVIWN